ncbi:protein of unknown function [Citrobacter freundii]|nr:protein of unknown function [Citrobacter freundii]
MKLICINDYPLAHLMKYDQPASLKTEAGFFVFKSSGKDTQCSVTIMQLWLDYYCSAIVPAPYR